MSGHNKWSKIKRTKGVLDTKKGKIFTKIIKEITIAARAGGGDADGNPRLRTAVLAAKAASMPKENVDRAIKKGTGELGGEQIEEHLYEGYGPGGVAILVETTSDNKNRTISDLRNIFKTWGGNMGEAGSVAWMFTHFGQLVFDKTKYPEDNVMDVALEAGAQDVSAGDDTVEVLTNVPEVYKVTQSFERVGMHPTSAGFSYVPKSSVPVEDRTQAERLLKLLEAIEDHDDVQRIHSNFEMDDKLFAELAGK